MVIQGKLTNSQIKEQLLDHTHVDDLEELIISHKELCAKSPQGVSKQRSMRSHNVDLEELKKIELEVQDFLGVNITAQVPRHLPGKLYFASPIPLSFAMSGITTMATADDVVSLMFGVFFVTFGYIRNGDDQSARYYPKFPNLNHGIKLGLVGRQEQLVSYAHEYTHFVTDQLDERIWYSDFPIFNEGLAIGVERFVGKMYFDESNDFAFVKESQRRQYTRAKSAYAWLCKEKGKTPNRIFTKIESLGDTAELRYQFKFGEPTPHALGDAFFQLAKKRYGDDVYKIALQERITL